MIININISTFENCNSKINYDYEYKFGHYNVYITNNSNQIIKTDSVFLSDKYSSSQKFIAIGKIYNKDLFREANSKEIDSLGFISLDKIFRLFWGDFILIRLSPGESTSNSKIEIIRSLNSQTPIFYSHCTKTKKIFLSSNLSNIINLTFKPKINQNYIKTFLSYGNFISQYTPYENINEIPIGSCILVNDDLSIIHKVIWDPVDFISNIGYNRVESQKKIFDIMYNVINLYSNSFKNILLEYSGGVDSTGLLYILNHITKKLNINLSAVNYVNNNINSANEKDYATRICKELEVKLLHHDTSTFLPFTQFIKEFSPNYLSSLLIYLADESHIGKLFREYFPENSIFMSGHGGDHLFSCPPLLESISDYWQTKKFDGILKKLKEISSYDRNSIFALLKLLLFYEKKSDFTLLKSSLFNFDILECKSNIIFQIENTINLKQCPKGKAVQIKGLFHAFAMLNQDIRKGITSFSIIYPLLSQPLVETILSIPTYELYGNGYDRLFFRELINMKYHNAKIWRKEKGETTGVLQLGIKNNFVSLKKLISEGFLASEGIINIDHTMKSLELVSKGYSHNLIALVNIISVELFIKAL